MMLVENSLELFTNIISLFDIEALFFVSIRVTRTSQAMQIATIRMNSNHKKTPASNLLLPLHTQKQ